MNYKKNVIVCMIFMLQLLSFNNSIAEKIEWVKNFGGIKDEHIDHVVVCSNNDIIVIGTFSDTMIFKSGSQNLDTLICENEYEDVFIVKFHSHGSFQWATSIAHGPQSYDWWLFPSVDPDGNLFLSGTFIGDVTIGKNEENEISFSSLEENSLDIFLTKILDDGEIDWARKLGDVEQESVRDIDTDDKGSVYITGRFWENSILLPGGMNEDITLIGNATSYSIFTTKYDKDGNIKWAEKILSDYDMMSYSITVSKTGKVAIGGYFSESIYLNSDINSDTLISHGVADIFIATYDSNGVYLWATSDGGTEFEMASDIEFDSQENIIVTGSFHGMFIMGDVDTLRSDNSFHDVMDDIFLAKYDSEGHYLWSLREGGSMLDGGEHIQIFKNDKILLSGFYWYEATFSKGKKSSKLVSNIADTCSHFEAKYTADGDLYWVADVDSSFTTFNTVMAVDSSENMIRAGEYFGNVNIESEDNALPVSGIGGFDIYLAKFVASPTTIKNINRLIRDIKLDQNYPNPFNPVTVINYSVGAIHELPVQVDLSIYNSLGQKVCTLISEKQNPGHYSVAWNASEFASGIYYSRLKSDTNSQVKKMLLIK
ncbi:MAG: T9SS type A sorting domain-containing protein [Calditrichaceae bacterium]|nr:T9SS type A sorting domain-containing protein [Calditrichaceae bacterium]